LMSARILGAVGFKFIILVLCCSFIKNLHSFRHNLRDF
jgi:choline-glycine betaine transporter